MPTEIYYTISFSVSILASVIGQLFCLLTISIIIFKRQCHTIHNLLACDLYAGLLGYFILQLVQCIYGLRKDWFSYQSACVFRAYLIVMMLGSSFYSFMIQAISRLFFAVFYKQKYLLTWRTNRILIILKWLVAFLASIEPFFIEHGYGLLPEYRVCGNSSKILSVVLFSSIMLFIIPMSIIIIIYYIILKQVRQSTSRVVPFASAMLANISATNTSHSFSKRDLKVMQRILILISILTYGGLPYTITVIWNIINPQSVPDELCTLSHSSVTFSAMVLSITQFFMNKKVRDITFKYLRCRRTFTI